MQAYLENKKNLSSPTQRLLQLSLACALLLPVDNTRAEFTGFGEITSEGIILFGRELVVAPGVPPAFSAADLDYQIPKTSDDFLPEHVQDQIKDLRADALANREDGQARLADHYLDGKMVEQNLGYALAWYQVAAYNGSPYAQYVLSVLYREGDFLTSNIRISAGYEAVANTHRNAVAAQRKLGERSLDFTSPFYNVERAERWLARAGQAGDVEAQLRLGDFYADGHDVVTQTLGALKWYGKAAAKESSEADFEIATMYHRGLQYLGKDDKRAFTWMSRAANAGDDFAQIHLGMMYAKGIGVRQSPVLAYAWLKLSEDHLLKSKDINTPFLVMLHDVSESLDYQQQIQAVQYYQSLKNKFHPE